MTNTPNQNNEDSIARDPKEMPSGVVAGDATISQTPSDPKVGVYAESLDILNGTEVFSSRKGDYLVARNVYTDAKPHVYDGLTNDEIIDKLVDEYDGKSESKTKKIEDADQQEKRSESPQSMPRNFKDTRHYEVIRQSFRDVQADRVCV